MSDTRSLMILMLVLSITPKGYAQKLEGPWMKQSEPGVISYPLNQIVEFSNDSIHIFEFDSLIDKQSVILNQRNIIFNDSITNTYFFNDPNTVIFEATYQTEDLQTHTSASHYVRILPTVDSLGLFNSLKQSEYNVKFDTRMSNLIFNRKLDESELIYLNNSLMIVSNYVSLKKRGETYFLLFYLNDYPIYALPIRKICANSFTLYGYPGLDDDIVANKIIAK